MYDRFIGLVYLVGERQMVKTSLYPTPLSEREDEEIYLRIP